MKRLRDNGKAKDLSEIASWLNISQPRVHQIFSLLFLAPRIQEIIILSDDPNLLSIPEYKVIEISKGTFFGEDQTSRWNLLKESIIFQPSFLSI